MKQPKKTLIYRPKKLIPGFKIEAGLTGFYAAIPDKQFKEHAFKIIYANSKIVDGTPIVEFVEKDIEKWNKAEKFRRFPDQWGRGMYTLGYFKMCEKL